MLRTSIIGPELNTSFGLFEWFLKQKSEVSGYTNAYFNGLTTLELAKIILTVIRSFSALSGLYHLGSHRISKFSLLELISKYYNHEIHIKPNSSVVVDRTLDCSNFKQEVDYRPPSWEQMIAEMRDFNSA